MSASGGLNLVLWLAKPRAKLQCLKYCLMTTLHDMTIQYKKIETQLTQPILRRPHTNFYVFLMIVIHFIVNNRYVLLCFRKRFHNSVRNEVIQLPRTNQNWFRDLYYQHNWYKKKQSWGFEFQNELLSTAITKNSWQFTRNEQ